MVKGLPRKIHELAAYYRGSPEGERKRPVDLMDDIVFLTFYFTNKCLDFIRGALKVVTSIADTQPVRALRLQLSLALATLLEFSDGVIKVSFVML